MSRNTQLTKTQESDDDSFVVKLDQLKPNALSMQSNGKNAKTIKLKDKMGLTCSGPGEREGAKSANRQYDRSTTNAGSRLDSFVL